MFLFPEHVLYMGVPLQQEITEGVILKTLVRFDLLSGDCLSPLCFLLLGWWCRAPGIPPPPRLVFVSGYCTFRFCMRSGKIGNLKSVLLFRIPISNPYPCFALSCHFN